MPHYEIHVTCTECGGEHPMRVRLYLETGPIYKQSIGDTYPGEPCPPQLQAVQGRKTLCLKTGRMFVQESMDEIFLVPTYPIPPASDR